VAQIGLGVIIHQPKDHQQHPIQFVRLLNSKFQGMIIRCWLGLLHPIQDVISLACVGFIQGFYACRINGHTSPLEFYGLFCGKAQEVCSLGVNRSGSEAMGLFMDLAMALSMP
jgi:hypothetical protein